jgi:retrograde regulation protein 2
MTQSKINPYPIPIINGFRASRADFHDTTRVLNTMSTSGTKIFGISKRRASHVPVVAFLINVLADALPSINYIQFCQGGVREGFLYDTLSAETRSQDPLLVATEPYASRSVRAILDLLTAALPNTYSPILSRRIPQSFTPHLLAAFTNLLFAHSSVPRESKPAVALYSTTFGILASANSLAHLDRALLALMLSERWAGDLAPAEESFRARLRQFVPSHEAWWSQYLGRVAALVGDTYPAGVISDRQWRIRLQTRWQQVTKKKQGTTDALVLRVFVNDDTSTSHVIDRESLRDGAERIEKIGKRKNWIKAEERIGSERVEDDYGVSVEVQLYGAFELGREWAGKADDQGND